MANKVELMAVIKAKDEASGVFNKIGKSNSKLIKGLGTLGAAAGVAALAIGGASIKMAVDFEKSMSNVSTLVDTSTESMAEMGEKVMEISKRVPVELADLSTALYDVRSAGISASDAMMVLEKSAMLGVAGLGTTQEAVNLATSAINAFGFEGEEAAKVFDTIQLTVKSGKTNISELAQSFGMVAGTANTAGVDFNELMAATAALTTTGLKSSVAQTQLREAILSIQAPSKDMKEIISDLGYESGEAMIKELGLVGSMEAIDEAAKGNIEILKPAYGSVQGLGAAIALTGEQGDAFVQTLKDMADGEGALKEAFDKQNETAAAQYQLLKNNLNVEMINLGNKILPRILDHMPQIIKLVETLTDVFMGLVDGALWAFDLIEKVSLQILGLTKEDLTYTPMSEAEMRGKIEGQSGMEWSGFEEGFTGRASYARGNTPLSELVEGDSPYTQEKYSTGEEDYFSKMLLPTTQEGTTINFDLRGATVTDEEITNKITDKIFKGVGFSQVAK